MGTMRERSPGVWELRVYTGRDPITGRPRQKSRTFRGGKRQAGKELAKLVAKQEAGELGGSNGTVGQLLDAWLRTGTPDLSPVTKAGYERTVRMLKPYVGAVRLNKLDPHVVESAYRDMTEAGVTVHQLRQCHASLRAALSTGQRWGWVPTNAAALARAPRVPKKDPVAPTIAEVSALVRALEVQDPDLACIVILGSLTGLRRGELCGLRWGDIEGTTLHVRRSWVMANGNLHLKLPKAGQERTAPLSGSAWLTLCRIASAQLERAQAAGTMPPDDGWVLSADGIGNDPRSPHTVGRAITAGARKAGVKISPHSLRRFAGSYLIANGVDIRTAASQLGHDPRVLLGHYAAQDPAKRMEAAEVLGGALGPGILS
jgi:integrase